MRLEEPDRRPAARARRAATQPPRRDMHSRRFIMRIPPASSAYIRRSGSKASIFAGGRAAGAMWSNHGLTTPQRTSSTGRHTVLGYAPAEHERPQHLDSEQFRSAPRTCRRVCGRLSLRPIDQLGRHCGGRTMPTPEDYRQMADRCAQLAVASSAPSIAQTLLALGLDYMALAARLGQPGRNAARSRRLRRLAGGGTQFTLKSRLFLMAG